MRSTLRPKILIVDSCSNDGTIEFAHALGVCTLVVKPETFNHGLTRELARKELGTDVVVMMTQDAYPDAPEALERLVAPILKGTAAVSYGRQLPRTDAGFFERFLREFNYPAESHVRTIADVDRFGANIFFCSDAFAAYDNRALDMVGGFPDTLSHEDAIVTARLVRHGFGVAYVAEARVRHSHASNLRFEFQRYFDAGYARTMFRSDLEFAGGHERIGGRYVAQLARSLRRRPWLIPYAVAHLAVKWVAFRAGAAGTKWSSAVCARLSGHGQYWARRHSDERKQSGLVA